MKIQMGELAMVSFIKDLLTLRDGSLYDYHTMFQSLNIKFKGDSLKVQEEIHNWLKAREEHLKPTED